MNEGTQTPGSYRPNFNPDRCEPSTAPDYSEGPCPECERNEARLDMIHEAYRFALQFIGTGAKPATIADRFWWVMLEYLPDVFWPNGDKPTVEELIASGVTNANHKTQFSRLAAKFKAEAAEMRRQSDADVNCSPSIEG